ncbi:GumC family protein [uncultured Sphingomonas sp.]|uniref:GumC family protein n=1 Tax=uncultured Sphingomonas sp. TaxID=158754 RepID=UPI0025E95F37|nr:polysaccharide biosynthesis tyrosine autokinase [uncultured Sphingomonas sp.]
MGMGNGMIATAGGPVDRPAPVGIDDLRDEEDAPVIDVRALWATLYRNRVMMAAIIGISLLLGLASAVLMPRIYTAHASVQIDQQVARVLGTEDRDPQAGNPDTDRFLQTQIDVFTSRAMARRVSDSLGLTGNDSFLRRMTGAREIKVKPEDGGLETLVLDTLQHNLSVELRRNSRVVNVSFASRDPALAAEIANSYAANFIEGNIQRKFSTSAYSRQFLQNQLALAKTRLEGSERDLIGYSRSARLIDASAGTRAEGTEGPRSLVTSQLVQLNADLSIAEANRLKAGARWEQARSTPLMALPEVQANEAIQRLMQKRSEARAELAETRRRLKPEHPVVIQAMAEIAGLDQEIRTQALEIRNAIRSQYDTAARQAGAIAGQVQLLKSSTLAEQDRGIRYNILKRDVDTNRQLYESLLQRFKEVSAEAGVASNNVTIVDTAEQPRRPTSPRPLLNMVIALAGGIALAALYAIGRDYIDDSIRDPQDVEAKLHLPLLGVVPDAGSGDAVGALDDPKSEIAEAYHAIRAAIELSSNQGLLRSILVTGSNKSEGKSTTSVALARDFASLGRRVLIIDADLRRPSLHRVFGVPLPDRGLSTVLAQLNPAESAIQPTQFTGLSFLPAGRLPPDPATLFAGDAMRALLDRLGEDYEVIVIDALPVLALADATQLTAIAQATVFVAQAGGALFGQVRTAVSRLTRAGGNVIGVVITKYSAKRAGYSGSQDYYRYRYEDASA